MELPTLEFNMNLELPTLDVNIPISYLDFPNIDNNLPILDRNL